MARLSTEAFVLAGIDEIDDLVVVVVAGNAAANALGGGVHSALAASSSSAGSRSYPGAYRLTSACFASFACLTSASSATQDLDDIPGLSSAESKIHPEKELRFLPIDLKRTWRPDATGRERTDAAQDRSWALTSLLSESKDASGDAILGELQFCFLVLLTLNNWSCLEQWKRLLTLIFTCKSAVPTHPDLFIRAIATLRLQVEDNKPNQAISALSLNIHLTLYRHRARRRLPTTQPPLTMEPPSRRKDLPYLSTYSHKPSPPTAPIPSQFHARYEQVETR